MKKIISIIMACAFTLSMAAAEESNLKEKLSFGVEFGINALSQDVTPPENVVLGKHNIHAYYLPWNLGATVEYFFGKGIFGIASGLRLTNYLAYYGKASDSGFYYWNIATDGNAEELIKMNSIKQTNNYLGLPVEFRIFFIPQDKIIRPYFKLDLSFNWLLHSKNKFYFTEDDGNSLKYSEIIEEDLGMPEKFNSTLDFAYGFRVGRDPFYGNIEIHFPTFLLTNSPVSFFTAKDLTALNAGVKASLQVPLSWGTEKHSNKEGEEIKDELLPPDDGTFDIN